MEKLLETIGKILKAIFSSEIFWLIVVAIAAYSLAVWVIVADNMFTVPIINIPVDARYIFAIAAALLLAKVLIWFSEQKELIQALLKIIERIFSPQTFWLIVVALTILGILAMAGSISVLGPDVPVILAFGGVALILAKIVLWTVKRVVSRHFA